MSLAIVPSLRLLLTSIKVCLGLSAWFLHEIRHGSGGPRGRTIYIIVIACVSIITSLIWMIPFTFTFFHVSDASINLIILASPF